jgi:hypothetical protein
MEEYEKKPEKSVDRSISAVILISTIELIAQRNPQKSV